MTYLDTVITQEFTAAELPAAVRAALGKPLRRAATLTQLAVVGALACLPAERRTLPTALLWQTRSGPRAETLALLEEVCNGTAEPMPYDFLATQPAIAAAQLKPFLPGLHSATCLPLADATMANWSLLLSLADHWLNSGRYAQVLCAQLDHADDLASGHWLALSAAPLENSLASLHLSEVTPGEALADASDFPACLDHWLAAESSGHLYLQSAASRKLAVEFARI
ncbi:hypothetical protein [Quatrionicoccus australiensis]|uniref:hypothetical protein n=1 Tax=Quatrionicoccus australiensis TaxID=138118 RepID=UPI001CFB968F|nr:hypothetical protein [Quatrionicoccus australiensis]MCB4361947.1 hypothetical protein [Quatrionicoccus australiensis]